MMIPEPLFGHGRLIAPTFSHDPGAWFFVVVNLLRVPLHALVWKTITFQTVVFDLLILPTIVGGVWSGIWIVEKIPE